MIILIDMDNTIAEFDIGLLSLWREKYPNEYYVPLEKRTTFHPHEDYPKHLQKQVIEICHSRGFILNLLPVPGSITAINEMLDLNYDVRFCTSHLNNYEFCILEKFQWIDKYFGSKGVDRIILTRDKTLIFGDILIDDKPIISGQIKPTWEHILYDQPYNRKAKDQRRLNWTNWREIIH